MGLKALVLLGLTASVAAVNSREEDGSWVAGAWSGCDCDKQVMDRKVKCQRDTKDIADDQCLTPKPATTKGCTCGTVASPVCPDLDAEWVWGDWSTCSDSCGGSQARAVRCVRDDGVKADCNSPSPPAHHACGACFEEAHVPFDWSDKISADFDANSYDVSDSPYSWSVSPWSACKKGCDHMQERTVTCMSDDAMSPGMYGYGGAEMTDDWGSYGGYGGYGGPSGGVVDDSLCSGDKPPTIWPCGACDKPEDHNPHCYIGSTYTNKYSDWTPCLDEGEIVFCGGGSQTRTATCLRDDGTEADSSNCVPPAALTQTCGEMKCETFDYVGGGDADWSECTVGCGRGYQSSTIRVHCASSNGYEVSEELCEETDKIRPKSTQLCDGDACTEPYYKFGPWKSCSAVDGCGDDGLAERDAKCFFNEVEAESEDMCEELGEQVTERPCNRVPCTVYYWSASAWDTCEKDGAPRPNCGGTRKRTIECQFTDSDGPQVTAASNCVGDGPRTEESCLPCDFCSDPDLNQGCSGNGSCSEGRCVCDAGFTGAVCDIDANACRTGVRGVTASGDSLECCMDGVVDANGSCCNGQSGAEPKLDMDGACCPSGHVDGCGRCSPEGVDNPDLWGQRWDSTGFCCPESGILDNQMLCCQAGFIDACGMCGGSGDTCGCVIATTATDGGARRRRLLQVSDDFIVSTTASVESLIQTSLGYPAGLYNVTVDRNGQSGVSIEITLSATANATNAESAVTDSDEIAGILLAESVDFDLDLEAPSVRITVVCEDDLCQTGEPEIKGQEDTDDTCFADCPIRLGSCDAPGSAEMGDSTAECGGLGLCEPRNLVCVCNAGYTGPACGACADGYVPNGSVCERSVAQLVADPVAAPSPDPAIDSDTEPDTDPDSGPDTDQDAGQGSDQSDSGGADPLEGDSGSTNAGLVVGLTLMSVVIVAGLVGVGWAWKAGKFGGGQPASAEQYAVDPEIAEV